MTDVSTWVAHATREPAPEFVTRLQAWWKDHATFDAPEPALSQCVWNCGPLHTLVLAHVDRAAHKRRYRTLYVSGADCPPGGEERHGLTPMSTLIPSDAYGPERVQVEHTGDDSPLAHSIHRAREDGNLLVTTVVTPAEFNDPNHYHEHSAALLEPLTDGVVLPILYLPRVIGEPINPEATEDLADLLSAHGYSPYSVDLDATEVGEEAVQRALCLLMEDVFDEVAQIKADAAARILSHKPRWPLVIAHASPTWELDAHCVRPDQAI